MRRSALCLLVVLSFADAAAAQQDAANVGARLMQDAAVKAAVEALRASEPQTIEDQIRLCEVEAPPFKEAKRAALYAQMFKEAGLTNVRIDKEGNVLGEKRGTQASARTLSSARISTLSSPRAPTSSSSAKGRCCGGLGLATIAAAWRWFSPSRAP